MKLSHDLTLIPAKELFFRLILKLEMHPNTNKISIKFCNSSQLAFKKKN